VHAKKSCNVTHFHQCKYQYTYLIVLCLIVTTYVESIYYNNVAHVATDQIIGIRISYGHICVFPLSTFTPVITIFNISMHPEHMIRPTEIFAPPSLLMPHEVPMWNIWINIYPECRAFIIRISIFKIHFPHVHPCELIVK
jgi:hypothetical protein